MLERRILIVDDDRAVRQMLAFGLERAGLEIEQANDAERALAILASTRCDLVLLDWVLPGMQGPDLIKTLRAGCMYSRVPIIMLTGRAAEDDKLSALECGADDYLVKPAGLAELLARIKALLRRRYVQRRGNLSPEPKFSMDKRSGRLSIDGRSVKLRPKEFQLLSFLLSHPERAHSRQQLVIALGDVPDEAGMRAIDVCVCRLREALQPLDCHRFVQTVHRTGYRFSTQLS